MTDLREHWAEVRKLLLDAMTETGTALPAETTSIVTEWLENNELELALRAMEEAAEEHGVLLPAKAVQHLKRAAHLMGVASRQ